jgi:hypothetical protein
LARNGKTRLARADKIFEGALNSQGRTAHDAAHHSLGGFRSRVVGVGPQIGFLFPVGDMQGYLNLKGYGEFAAENRPAGWNTWLTFSISPMAPASTVAPTRRIATK